MDDSTFVTTAEYKLIYQLSENHLQKTINLEETLCKLILNRWR